MQNIKCFPFLRFLPKLDLSHFLKFVLGIKKPGSNASPFPLFKHLIIEIMFGKM